MTTKLLRALVLSATVLLPSSIHETAAASPPLLSIDVWQGPQRAGNHYLEYLSSLLLRSVKVDGVQVPDGTVVQLWTPSISVTGIPSRVVGECQVTNGECILPVDMDITQDIAKTGNYATNFYLPTYNAVMGYGWHWRPCE